MAEGIDSNKQTSVKNIVAIIWIICCCVLIKCFISYGYIYYEINDDIFLSIFPSGFLGDYYPYTIHNNIVLGWILALLSSILPQTCNVSICFFIFSILITYIVLGLWLIYEQNTIIGICLGSAYVLSTYETLLHRLNYSKTGAIIFAVGIVIFASTVDKCFVDEKKRIFWKVLSFILILIGCMYRYKATLALLPFMFICILYNFQTGNANKQIKKLITYWAVVITGIAILWAIDFSVYHFDNEWKKFKEFNDIREKVMDYDIPSYEGHQTEYQAIGWSENDYKLFCSWSFADDNTYNIENLRAILNMRGTKRFSRKTILYIADGVLSNIRDHRRVTILIWIFTFFCLYRNFRNLKYILLNLIFMVGELAYLIYIGRAPERALMIILIAALTTMFLFNSKKRYKKQDYIITVLVFLYMFRLSSIWNINNEEPAYRKAIEINMKEFLSDISEKQENLYVWNVFDASDAFLTNYEPIEGLGYGLFSNSVFSGGWPVQSPVLVDIANNYGDGYNVFKILAENENAYFVCLSNNSEELITNYIREHYRADAQCTLVQELNGFYIYSYAK